jgi:hypothetical protein
MTQLLQTAYAKIAQLPEADQDAMAALILAELESEERWQQAFEGSQDMLAKLAAEALAEHHAGKTEPLDPDSL